MGGLAGDGGGAVAGAVCSTVIVPVCSTFVPSSIVVEMCWAALHYQAEVAETKGSAEQRIHGLLTCVALVSNLT